MSHEFESGVFYREAAWHQLGTVVDEWPGSWDEARKIAGLTWEVEAAPLTMPIVVPEGIRYSHVNGWQGIIRNDKPLYREMPTSMGYEINPDALLSIQKSSYQIIRNEQFGKVIEHVVGDVGEHWQYETLISLSGGRNIVCLLKARVPLNIGPDPSKTYTFLAFTSRHDGQGGLRCIPTQVRVVCRNTHNAAEMLAHKDRVGFTIRHTANWEQQLNQVANVIQAAVKEGRAWEELASKLGMRRLIPAQRDRMLSTLFKTDSSMTPLQERNVLARRGSVIEILGSKTCEGIEGTMLGFVQAVDEYADHVMPARSTETAAIRTLLTVQPLKARALALARAAADR